MCRYDDRHFLLLVQARQKFVESFCRFVVEVAGRFVGDQESPVLQPSLLPPRPADTLHRRVASADDPIAVQGRPRPAV